MLNFLRLKQRGEQIFALLAGYGWCCKWIDGGSFKICINNIYRVILLRKSGLGWEWIYRYLWCTMIRVILIINPYDSREWYYLKILNHLTTWNKRWVLDNPHSVLTGFQFDLVSLIKVLVRKSSVKAEIYSSLYSSLKASVGIRDHNAA